jgi:hypothetical protein
MQRMTENHSGCVALVAVTTAELLFVHVRAATFVVEQFRCLHLALIPLAFGG